MNDDELGVRLRQVPTGAALRPDAPARITAQVAGIHPRGSRSPEWYWLSSLSSG